jgi:CheY-like chemotaxis protein
MAQTSNFALERKHLGLFRKKLTINSVDFKLSRDDLLRRSRILIVDDERPDLIEDLQRAGFAVDYEADITAENINIVDRAHYDLVILDFKSVGKAFGADEGLDLLRHIKRVNPSTIVFAYTSKSLGAEHADFYRSSDGVLRKDAGISESLDKIEDGLRRARSPQNLWASILHIAGIRPGSKEDLAWQDLYVRGLSKPNKITDLKNKVMNTIGGDDGKGIAMSILEKLIEVGVKSYIG